MSDHKAQSPHFDEESRTLYILGLLDGSTARQYEKHFASCELCLQQVAELQQISKQIRSPGVSRRLDGISRQALNRVRSQPAGASKWLQLTAAAALLALAAGLSVLAARDARTSVLEVENGIGEGNLMITDKEIRTVEIYEAADTITVADLDIDSSGDLTLSAQNGVKFKDGFAIRQGGTLKVISGP